MKRKTVILSLFGIMVMCLPNAKAQKYGATAQDSDACMENLSIYREFYKQEAYKDAYEPWKAVIRSCPKNHINNYVRGLNILKNLYTTAATQQEKDKYFSEMLTLMDIRSSAYGEEWNNIARKAELYTTYKPDATKEAYDLFAHAKASADSNKTILDQQYCVEYLQATIKYLQAKKASNEEWSILFDVYDYASEAMEDNLTMSANELDSVTQLNDTKKMAKLQTEVDNTRTNIQALETLIEPFASCDKIIPIYQDRFNANPNDLELLKKITTNLERKHCMSSELFFQATKNLHTLEPTPRSASLMGQMLLSRDQYAEAAKYLEESEKTAPEISVKSKSALALAQCLIKTNKYSAARDAARRAVGYNKSLAGMASVLIAQMYLATAGQNAAFAAYDEAARAKSLDPSVSADANKIMSAARGRFPSKEDLFFKGQSAGGSVGVGGWIGGSATVRTR